MAMNSRRNATTIDIGQWLCTLNMVFGSINIEHNERSGVRRIRGSTMTKPYTSLNLDHLFRVGLRSNVACQTRSTAT